MTELKQLLENSYYTWLKKELVFSEVGNQYVSISTPFDDTNYDNINLYARFVNQGEIELSDFGNTIFDLSETGITIDKRSKTIWRIFNQILNDFGVTKVDEALTITAPVSRFPIAKTRLLQAIMRVNDLVYLNKETVTASFNEVVSNFMHTQKVLFNRSVEITNLAGSNSHFDFAIPTANGEKLVKTVSRPNDINAAKIFNYDVKATAELRKDALFIYLADDLSHKKGITSETFGTALKDLDDKTAVAAGFSDLQRENDLLSNLPLAG